MRWFCAIAMTQEEASYYKGREAGVESMSESLREIIAKWTCQYCNRGRKLVYADGDRERHETCKQCGGTGAHEHAREVERLMAQNDKLCEPGGPQASNSSKP